MPRKFAVKTIVEVVFERIIEISDDRDPDEVFEEEADRCLDEVSQSVPPDAVSVTVDDYNQSMKQLS